MLYQMNADYIMLFMDSVSLSSMYYSLMHEQNNNQMVHWTTKSTPILKYTMMLFGIDTHV